MNFKKVFRGYDPNEVDKYIADTAAKEQKVRASQKERIDELSDENYSLRQQVKQYKTDEQAISKSLIASQHLAQELKFDAERYSDLVLSRAKIFYATWRAYSKTLIAALSEDEVREFNILQKKIEDVINAYEGKDVAKEMEEKQARHERETASATARQPDTRSPSAEPAPQPAPQQQPSLQQAPAPQSAQATQSAPSERQPAPVSDERPLTDEEKWRHAREVVDVTPSEKTMGIYANPIGKVEQAAGQVIDLRELTKTDMSLEDLCAELGLIVKKD